jgi:hypothetical protein
MPHQTNQHLTCISYVSLIIVKTKTKIKNKFRDDSTTPFGATSYDQLVDGFGPLATLLPQK